MQFTDAPVLPLAVAAEISQYIYAKAIIQGNPLEASQM
jgi:hypothetical protein